MLIARSSLFAALVAPWVALWVAPWVPTTAGGFSLVASAHAASSSELILAADDGVIVREAWARASAGATTTGAAYVTLAGGAEPDQLIAASTPVAAKAEVHETINDNGVMKMRPVPAVPIPPRQTVIFAPGGIHIMLTGLKQRLTAGQSFPLTLTFAHAAPVTVDVKVRGIGAPGSMSDRMHMQ